MMIASVAGYADMLHYASVTSGVAEGPDWALSRIERRIEVVDDSARQPFGVFFTYQRHQCPGWGESLHLRTKKKVSEGD